MSFRSRTTALVLVALASLSVMTPAAANAAQSWGTLKVYSGSSLLGQAHGTAETTASNIWNKPYFVSSTADGVRVETTWLFYECTSDAGSSTSCPSQEWTYEGRSDTKTTTSPSQQYQSVHHALLTEADRARSTPRVCSPRPWGTPVPCSSYAINTFNY